MAYLELKALTKSFPRNGRDACSAGLPVLRDINLSIRENEFVCIVGRSGAGKTTLISLIAGLIEPDAGKIILDGKPIDGPGPDRGVIFQTYSLLPWLNVYENVHLAVDAVAPDLSAREKQRRTEYYVNLVNLSAALKKLPRELSGGMRQRVAVARGLAMDPKVLLLDEPFSALDALTRATLQEELARIWMETRKTMVMITNDIDEAILLADTIYTLTSSPGATLGPAIFIDAGHPRSRGQLSGQATYQTARRETLRLLATGGKTRIRTARALGDGIQIEKAGVH
ncbi:MAG: nitrate/nitrite transport system ATP-binding protein [Candidatus Binatota bacterium]|jgi:nitrate/nitrite transport system ATP-binding protein|nr:nitrate/nitrite transport system ATP-binding protein [Candidatus Binatota bacterium]